MKRPRLTGTQCPCGRDEVQLAGSLKVCRGCGADVAFCEQSCFKARTHTQGTLDLLNAIQEHR